MRARLPRPLFCLETICYALVDMAVGHVVGRRRVSHWVFIIAVLSMVTALGPVGVAVSKVLWILCVDSILPRDQFTRRRTVVAVLIILLFLHCPPCRRRRGIVYENSAAYRCPL